MTVIKNEDQNFESPENQGKTEISTEMISLKEEIESVMKDPIDEKILGKLDFPSIKADEKTEELLNIGFKKKIKARKSLIIMDIIFGVLVIVGSLFAFLYFQRNEEILKQLELEQKFLDEGN